MRLLRSWPRRVPPGRAHVVDDVERVVLDNHDYAPLSAYAGDDLLVLEWDIAVGQEDLLRFAARAATDPGRVLVAPYRIYADRYSLPGDVWAHRHWAGEPAGMSYMTGVTPLADGDPFCQVFGLGMVYLPAVVLAGWFAAGWASHFGDVEFSMWHYLHVRHDVPVCWEVRPVHLNYEVETVRKGIG